MLLDTTTFLGPARVLEVLAGCVRVTIGEEELDAILATPFPYQPKPDDVLLVIGQGERHYVIGVIEGRGRTEFTAPGSLDLRATGGPIRLVSPQGVQVSASRIELKARELSATAETCRERFREASRKVEDLCELQAGEVREIARDQHVVRAENVVQLARKDVRIDGESINLG